MYFSKINKLPCFVADEIGLCPKCKRPTTNTSITYISKRKREIPISTHICTKCNTYVFSYKLYQTYKGSLIDLYSQALAQQSLEPRIYTYCEFNLYNIESKREITVLIQDAGKSHREVDQWVLTNRSTIGIECLKAIANDVYNIKLGDIDYIIRNIEVCDAKYIKRYKDDAYYHKYVNSNNKDPYVVDCGSDSVDVYVYFKLSNSCLNEQHPVESVTMRSLNSQTGKRYQVNAYYCSKCKKYFINHEAVKDMINRNMYPAFHYISGDHYDGELKPMSQLMLYGYNARADGPSTVTRHNILKWVIDSGLMSKPEIIKDLQFKIAYNGKRPGNEAARVKWEDDLDFLNTYVADNTKVIKGRLRR